MRLKYGRTSSCKLGEWDRDPELSVLTVEDSNGDSWQMSASRDGSWRVKDRPRKYDDLDIVYGEGQVPDEVSSTKTFAAAKKAARTYLYEMFDRLGISLGDGAPKVTTSPYIPNKRAPRKPSVTKNSEYVSFLPKPAPASAQTPAQYKYRPLYRPAGFSTIPKGWEYVEVPRSLAQNRPDLPVSQYPHGVIAYSRPLTDEEISRYELESVD